MADSISVHCLEYMGSGQMLFCSKFSCHRKKKKKRNNKRNKGCHDMEKALEIHQMIDFPFNFSYMFIWSMLLGCNAWHT